jgi:hypothetical protein
MATLAKAAASDRGTTSPAYDWLAGDLHNHCERHDLVDEHFSGLDDRLDFVALTNHAQKPIFAEQVDMVARGREMLEIPVFFGLEWNAPEGVHANVIFPPFQEEAEVAAEFIRQFDRRADLEDNAIEQAFVWLAALPADQRPIVFFNHPFPGHWADDVIARYIAADPLGSLVIGIEAVNGHQAGKATDPDEFPGCRPDGSSDQVYKTGRPFSLLSNSDFHVHKQSRFYDYPMGVFSRSVVGVPQGRRGAAAIFEGLRAGRTWAILGHWLIPHSFHIGDAGQGDTALTGKEPTTLHMHFELQVPARVDIIGQLTAQAPAAVLHEYGMQPSGQTDLNFAIPAHSAGFVRLRVTAETDQRPPISPGFNGGGVSGPTTAHSSAILIADSIP